MRTPTLLLAALLCCSPRLVACGSGTDTSADDSSLTDFRKKTCHSNTDCHNGQICKSGKCVNPAPQCTSNTDCANGQVCLSGSCAACTADSQCGSGLVCANGACGQPSGGGGGPTPNPPPASCDQRTSGV